MAPADNVGYKLILATSISLFLSAASIFLRLVCRRLKNIPLRTDDYFAISSLVLITAIGVASLLLIRTDFGSTASSIGAGQLTTYHQLSFTIFLLYPLTVTFAKLSVLFFYRRILPVKQILVSSSIVSCVLLVWCIIALCTAIFRCTAYLEAWLPTSSSECIGGNTYALLSQIPSIVIDIAIIVIPLKSVWDSVLKTSQKAIATGFFAAGTLTLVGDLVKLTIMLGEQGSSDNTDYQVNVFTWMNVTPALAIVAASIPVLRPLIDSTKRLGSKRNSDTAGILPADEERAGATTPAELQHGTLNLASPSDSTLLNPPSKAHTREERVKSIFGEELEEKKESGDRNSQFFMDL